VAMAIKWKYFAYLPVVAAVVGGGYTALRVVSDLEMKLDEAHSMASDAHYRMDDLTDSFHNSIKDAVSRSDDVSRNLENELKEDIRVNKEVVQRLSEANTYTLTDFQKELLELQKTIALLEGVSESVERKINDSASFSQLEDIRNTANRALERSNDIDDVSNQVNDVRSQTHDLRQSFDNLFRRLDEIEDRLNRNN
jgi:predicted RNase H-like nuclease (RuvC/YqgF family)